MIVGQWPDYLVSSMGDARLEGAEESVWIFDSIDAMIDWRAGCALKEIEFMASGARAQVIGKLKTVLEREIEECLAAIRRARDYFEGSL